MKTRIENMLIRARLILDEIRPPIPRFLRLRSDCIAILPALHICTACAQETFSGERLHVGIQSSLEHSRSIGCWLSSCCLFITRLCTIRQEASSRARSLDDSGSVLKGARVELLPLGIATSVNSQGEFVLRDILPGEYTLTTTYIGFKTDNQEVDVVAGKTLNFP